MNGEPPDLALRLVIVDDNPLFLETASAILDQPGVDVVGVARTSGEARRLAALLQPDVILVDVELGEESGFELADGLAASGSARIVLISAHPESELTELVAASHAAGFVSKPELSVRAVLDLLDP